MSALASKMKDSQRASVCWLPKMRASPLEVHVACRAIGKRKTTEHFRKPGLSISRCQGSTFAFVLHKYRIEMIIDNYPY